MEHFGVIKTKTTLLKATQMERCGMDGLMLASRASKYLHGLTLHHAIISSWKQSEIKQKRLPVLLIYFDDREETIESTPLPTDGSKILEDRFMEGYCFVEVEKK
jgi:hypothetical protein